MVYLLITLIAWFLQMRQDLAVQNVMTHSHSTGPAQEFRPRNDGFLYYYVLHSDSEREPLLFIVLTQTDPPPPLSRPPRYGQVAGGKHPTGMHTCFHSGPGPGTVQRAKAITRRFTDFLTFVVVQRLGSILNVLDMLIDLLFVDLLSTQYVIITVICILSIYN